MSGGAPQEPAGLVLFVAYEEPFRLEIQLRGGQGFAEGPIEAMSFQVHAALLAIRASCDRHIAVLESVIPGARWVPR